MFQLTGQVKHVVHEDLPITRESQRLGRALMLRAGFDKRQ